MIERPLSSGGPLTEILGSLDALLEAAAAVSWVLNKTTCFLDWSASVPLLIEFLRNVADTCCARTPVSSVLGPKGGHSIETYARVACEGLLPVRSCIQAGTTGECRVYAFSWHLVQSAIDDARDVGALRLVQDGIVNRDMSQDRTGLALSQPINLEQRVRDFSGSWGRLVHRGRR